jgi:ribosomal protein S12 methylthiotransferase
VVVNTCGFVEAAKKDSVDTLLAGRRPQGEGPVAPRPSWPWAAWPSGTARSWPRALPEADAVLGFDDYPDIAARLRSILAGEAHVPHVPQDRRKLLPISPDRARRQHVPAPAPPRARPAAGCPPSGPRAAARLDGGPMAPLKLASGCDRRCTFCAIPSFRGSFVSRARRRARRGAWLAEQGVRELFLVSENSTSYGKDLGDLRLLETLLPELAAIDGIDRVRVSYLQPAETRPGLVEAIATTPGVAPYFDLSFQHASATGAAPDAPVRRPESFLGLLERVRTLAPRPASAPTSSSASPARPRTTSDAVRLPRRRPARRHRRVRLLRRGRHRGREGFDGKLDEDEIAPGSSTSPGSSRSSPPSAPRSGSARPSRCSSSPSTGPTARGPRRAPGPEVDGTTTLLGAPSGTGRRPGHADVVSAPTGVDLVARPAETSR